MVLGSKIALRRVAVVDRNVDTVYWFSLLATGGEGKTQRERGGRRNGGIKKSEAQKGGNKA